MRVIIDVPLEHFDEAVSVVRGELVNFHRYDRIGWGWNYGPYENGRPRYFVRRIKDGLSITSRAVTAPSPTPETTP